MEHKALNINVAVELGGALQRISELSGKKIIESTDAAEKRGLEAFVARVTTENARELLGCWFTVQQHYRPLIQGFAGLMRSCLETIDRENKGPNTPEAAPAKECQGSCDQGGNCCGQCEPPSNVVNLKQS